MYIMYMMYICFTLFYIFLADCSHFPPRSWDHTSPAYLPWNFRPWRRWISAAASRSPATKCWENVGKTWDNLEWNPRCEILGEAQERLSFQTDQDVEFQWNSDFSRWNCQIIQIQNHGLHPSIAPGPQAWYSSASQSFCSGSARQSRPPSAPHHGSHRTWSGLVSTFGIPQNPSGFHMFSTRYPYVIHM